MQHSGLKLEIVETFEKNVITVLEDLMDYVGPVRGFHDFIMDHHSEDYVNWFKQYLLAITELMSKVT